MRCESRYLGAWCARTAGHDGLHQLDIVAWPDEPPVTRSRKGPTVNPCSSPSCPTGLDCTDSCMVRAPELVERVPSEPFRAPELHGVVMTPAQWLKWAVAEVTAAIDAAHQAGAVIPPQAAMGVAILDTTAKSLEAQKATGLL